MPARIKAAGPGRAAAIQAATVKVIATAHRPVRGRGLARAIATIDRGFADSNFVILELDGSRLKVDLSDTYWLAPLLRKTGYEPEIGRILAHVLGPDSAFVDCGANMGYWSAFAATRIRNPDRVVAIEAAPVMFERLRENAELNGHPFKTLHAAVSDRSGERVDLAFDVHRHSWASADPSTVPVLRDAGFDTTVVETITVDDAVAGHIGEGYRDLIVKIDVEGSEAAALAGSSASLSRGALVIYEEHGREMESPATSWLLKDPEMTVFFCASNLGLIEVHEAQATQALKPDPAHGYNLVACRRGTHGHESMLRLVRR